MLCSFYHSTPMGDTGLGTGEQGDQLTLGDIMCHAKEEVQKRAFLTRHRGLRGVRAEKNKG